MAKKKKLTSREKKERADFKKRMQEKGIIPPDKRKLNRKKFIKEAMAEWDGRSDECCIWEYYIEEAICYMLHQTEGISTRVSLEAVGAAKVLKLAIRLQEFEKTVEERGERGYSLGEQYDYIRDILDA